MIFVILPLINFGFKITRTTSNPLGIETFNFVIEFLSILTALAFGSRARVTDILDTLQLQNVLQFKLVLFIFTALYSISSKKLPTFGTKLRIL